MCSNDRSVKWAKRLINLTGRSISLYEDRMGNVCTFKPENKKLPNVLISSNNCFPVTIYVVKEERLEEIKKSGRELDDIALALDQDVGRGGILIDRLFWAKDPTIRVRLF